LLAVATLFPAGCELIEASNRSLKASMDALRPRSGGYADGNVEGNEDVWNNGSFEGRADQPMEKESDALTKYIDSPKARAINRSLGIE
jgi:hypothetical protein